MKRVTENRIQRIKSNIKSRFGSIRHFCVLARFNYWTATNAFNGRLSNDHMLDVLSDIERLIQTTPVPPCSECINTQEREFVRVALITRWKSIQKFVDNNPDFSMTFVHNVISGKRKIRDNRFNQLIETVKS
jgi:hypothetical protein